MAVGGEFAADFAVDFAVDFVALVVLVPYLTFFRSESYSSILDSKPD